MYRKSIKTVLLVEDNCGDARLLREIFNEQGARTTELTHVQCMKDAETYLTEQAVDVILLDLGLPDAQGLGALRRARAAAPSIPLVVLTSLDDESLAAQALQEGAQDYLVKGQLDTYGSTRGLLRALRYAAERKFMEDELFAEKERAEVTLNCIADAVICTNGIGNVSYLNAVAERITGWRGGEAVGRVLGEVLHVFKGPARERIEDLTVLDDCGDDLILASRDGCEYPIEYSAAPIHSRSGAASGAVFVLHDESAAHAMALRMAHSAEHDALTGLPNRLLMSDRVGRAIALAARRGKQAAVMFLDLDGFKHINDSLGHQVGDKLLQSVSERLIDCLRGSDTVSRQGGDEFVVLLSEMERPEDAMITARRILEAVSKAHTINDRDIHVTTSIGVSVYPQDGLDSETLMKSADTAMYQAKEGGRQTYKFFKPEMNVAAVERRSIEEALRRSLDRNEFTLCYQPKVDLRTGAITGAEALIRWTHPQLGLASQFIPVAEACGLIVPIGAWALREACRQAQAWASDGLPAISVAVNVSAKEFQDEQFLERVFTTLQETGLPPSCLELELTETVLMKRVEATAAILQTLRERGVRVAIDDFGTGYSSLSYLRKFPVDTLKIDQAFVRQISNVGEDTAIVTAVISMARSLNLRVIAEGVETLGELMFLRAHQCDEGQGYYFGRPLSAEHFATTLKEGLPPYAAESRISPSPVVQLQSG